MITRAGRKRKDDERDTTPKDPYILGLGRRIRATREAKGWTQGQLGVLINAASETICQFESGDRPPSVRRLCELARALNVHPGYLLTGEGDPSPTFSRGPSGRKLAARK